MSEGVRMSDRGDGYRDTYRDRGALLRRIVAAFDADRAGHDMRCLPELVAAIADAREVVR